MSRRLSTAEFIEKAQKVHGANYDYSSASYNNSKAKISIICRKHGLFEQRPNDHLRGKGCKKCAGNQQLTTESFVKRAREVHGDRYDYSKVVYIRSSQQVTVICERHGAFKQRPSEHQKGQGCPRCGILSRAKKQRRTNQEFVEQARLVHGNRYDYSLSTYEHNTKPVTIVCRQHGSFTQAPNNHINQSQGCKDCANIRLHRKAAARVLTTKEFIKRAYNIHENQYDYSQVKYERSNRPVKIVCKKHGAFKQKPNDHLQGNGCKRCAETYQPTTKEFIKKAQAVHSDRYDYSQVIYKNSKTKIEIICSVHGLFKQAPGSHLQGQGCVKCSGRYQPTTEEFIEQAQEIHDNRYDYSQVEYIKSDSKVKIICRIHGSFFQTPNAHIQQGQGCKMCGIISRTNANRMTREEFVLKGRELHGDQYDYSLVQYLGGRKKVTIVCKEHGKFKQTPHGHLRGQGCSRCAGNQPLTALEFIQRAKIVHGDRFDYALTNFINSKTKITIICPDHGQFKQTPRMHLQGRGCPHYHESLGEATVASWLDACDIVYEREKRFEDCRDKLPLPFDFYLPEENYLIEYDGEQHYQPSFTETDSLRILKGIQRRDAIKTEFANQNSIQLLRIKYDQDILKALQTKLGNLAKKQPPKQLKIHFKFRFDAFLKQARSVHGDRYDYSQVRFRGSNEKVKITCPDHGLFEQAPSNHVNQKQGCPACGRIKSDLNRRKTTKEFIIQARNVHGHRYDYSEAEYILGTQFVTIICRSHGSFEQTPDAHVNRARGCPSCSKLMRERRLRNSRKTTDEFVEQAYNVHDNRYDYSLVNYESSKDKVTIICPDHGSFEQTANTHLNGAGCSKCANNRKLTTSEFTEQAQRVHKNRYDYSLVEYQLSNILVKIICKEHGYFNQAPNSHLQGQGCPKCAGNLRLTTEKFVELARKVHHDKYDYSLVSYRGNKEKVTIICREHGSFEQKPNSHVSLRQGCPHCGRAKSERSRRLTTEEFIKRAIDVHRDAYDYSKVDYQGSKVKVTIICRYHGAFQQRPNDHQQGKGCKQCSRLSI